MPFSNLTIETFLFSLLFSLVTDFIGITGARSLIVISSKFWRGALVFMEKRFYELTENLFSEKSMPVKKNCDLEEIFFRRDGMSIDIKQINYASKKFRIKACHNEKKPLF